MLFSVLTVFGASPPDGSDGHQDAKADNEDDGGTGPMADEEPQADESHDNGDGSHNDLAIALTGDFLPQAHSPDGADEAKDAGDTYQHLEEWPVADTEEQRDGKHCYCDGTDNTEQFNHNF